MQYENIITRPEAMDIVHELHRVLTANHDAVGRASLEADLSDDSLLQRTASSTSLGAFIMHNEQYWSGAAAKELSAEVADECAAACLRDDDCLQFDFHKRTCRIFHGEPMIITS